MDRLKELAKKGLYSPEQEHDACGVGVVANIKGQKTHQIIDEGVQVLINLGQLIAMIVIPLYILRKKIKLTYTEDEAEDEDNK